MKKYSPFHVIVLDDRSRFALHTWRYLSRSVGFGIGNVSIDGSGFKDKGQDLEHPWKLEMPAGDAVIWWICIHADSSQWVKDLDTVLKTATDRSRRMFLIDFRGDQAGSGEFWKSALAALDEREIDLDPRNVWLVSSYGVGSVKNPYDPLAEPFHVRPKSGTTLQDLTNRIWAKEAPPKESKPDFHFLVTGAGFELRSDRYSSINPLGISSTSDLLERAYESSEIWHPAKGKGVAGRKTKSSLPLPPLMANSMEWRAKALGRVGDQGLDGLWNVLLEKILEDAKKKAENKSSDAMKADMLRDEQKARESFRASFVRDDWGEVTQALDAAILPWDVWLTTNYTRLVDRAVEMQRRQVEASNGSLAWRILSLASEAEQLSRQIFFEPNSSAERRARERLVFKLHGDLGHLSTMAMAGEDKELFSLIPTQAVTNCHPLYDAAQSWITQLLKERPRGGKDAQVYWHIVGHGLKDRVLVETIKRIVESVRREGLRHQFLFVNPFEGDLREEIRDAGGKGWKWHWQPYQAQEWLAMLRKFKRHEGRMWTPNDGDLHRAVLGFVQEVD